ncbi:MAG: adenylosuccinate synthase, partial [Flavobacteriia bacterium]|nr:adenylosuccinate synthase [Flavobacteriia bacterium]
ISELTKFEDAPIALKDYVSLLEAKLEVPIRLVSVGPDRAQTLFR